MKKSLGTGYTHILYVSGLGSKQAFGNSAFRESNLRVLEVIPSSTGYPNHQGPKDSRRALGTDHQTGRDHLITR